MCVLICRRRFVKYVVSPAEADMQVGCCRDQAGDLDLGIPVCRDSDEIAYGNRLVIFIDNWAKEEYRIVNLDVPVTDAMRTVLPIFYYYRWYGMRIIHWWAAVMGCDIFKKDLGIVSAGRGVFVNALRSFDDEHQRH
jgi:hypothetical protein